jgi:hypothetical protein
MKPKVQFSEEVSVMTRGVLGVLSALGIALVCMQAAAQEKEFTPGTDENLSWVSYDEAVSQAKTNYKPILVYFYGDKDKSLCELAETKMFKNSTVKGQAKKFAAVKVSGDDEKMTQKYSVPPGSFAIVILNFQLKELAKVTSEKDLKKLSTVLKDAAKENDEQNKKLKTVKKYYDKAMQLKDAKHIREAVQILEEIAKLGGKVESPYIEQASKYLQELEKAGSAALSEAENLVGQAEQSLYQARVNGSRYFREDIARSAQQKLMEVSRDYPVQALAKRLTEVQTRLAQVTAEYQKLVQQEQEQEKGKK